ncbi:hypothetical protein KFK09_022065 [Dendrobium nobile]|uniref:Uncharacterized protein n=1 Tax=Dendrobium nobile TaxID=94219 RepID=A0A8T3AJ13_DENNO|nr:hypothetical protein KFK09_022065 [Dendrobium nobile]
MFSLFCGIWYSAGYYLSLCIIWGNYCMPEIFFIFWNLFLIVKFCYLLLFCSSILAGLLFQVFGAPRSFCAGYVCCWKGRADCFSLFPSFLVARMLLDIIVIFCSRDLRLLGSFLIFPVALWSISELENPLRTV